MSDYLHELIRDTELYRPDFSHTYMAYLKLVSDKELNLKFELVGLNNINDQLRDVFENNISSGEIICVIDMGEGFDYKIVGIEYRGFTLIFACVMSEVIFMNYFPLNEKFPQNEDICLYGLQNELKDACVRSINIDGSEYQAINTHKPFIAFCDSKNYEVAIDVNASFWIDIQSYLDSKPRLGRYGYVQLGTKIIITSFEKVEKKTWADILPRKLLSPTEIRRITNNDA